MAALAAPVSVLAPAPSPASRPTSAPPAPWRRRRTAPRPDAGPPAAPLGVPAAAPGGRHRRAGARRHGVVGLPGCARPAATPSAAAPAGAVHVVAPGDTIWSVARRLQPEGDVRPLVDRLVAAHGSALLQPGDRIALAG